MTNENKLKVPSYEYKKFLQNLVKAYNSFEECRSILEDLKTEYDVPCYLDEDQIDQCLSAIEKGLGWQILANPDLVNLEEKK